MIFKRTKNNKTPPLFFIFPNLFIFQLAKLLQKLFKMNHRPSLSYMYLRNWRPCGIRKAFILMHFHRNQIRKHVLTNHPAMIQVHQIFGIPWEIHNIKKKEIIKTTSYFGKNTGDELRRAGFGLSPTVFWLCDLE